MTATAPPTPSATTTSTASPTSEPWQQQHAAPTGPILTLVGAIVLALVALGIVLVVRRHGHDHRP